MMYQKLVRDNIPAIIEKNGETCVTRTLSDKEYEDALTNKLQEEMADVMEVLYAMGKTRAVSKREVEQVRSQKEIGRASCRERV